MDSLIVSSVSEVQYVPVSGKVNLSVNLPEGLRYFEGRIVSAFNKKIEDVSYNNERSGNFIIFSLESAGVIYIEKESGGLFGGRIYERKVELKYSIVSDGARGTGESMNLTHYDLIAEEDLSAMSNPNYPFTQAEVPQGNEFRHLLEPAIATAASAVLVYLFFTVRNN